MDFRDRMLSRLETAADVPTLPGVFLKVFTLLNDANASATQVAAIIEGDPPLSAEILQIANSARLGAVDPVGSVQLAVARLGARQAGNVTLALSAVEGFESHGPLDCDRFWRHSLSVPFAAQILHRHRRGGEQEPQGLFACGILHNVGILLLDQYAGAEYASAISAARDQDRPLVQAEQERLGLDHTELGAWLLTRWGLPTFLINGVRHHHDPTQAGPGALALAELIHLANFTCNNQGIDNGTGGFPGGFSEAAWFDCGISLEDVPEIIEQVNAEVDRSNIMLATSRRRG